MSRLLQSSAGRIHSLNGLWPQLETQAKIIELFTLNQNQEGERNESQNHLIAGHGCSYLSESI